MAAKTVLNLLGKRGNQVEKTKKFFQIGQTAVPYAGGGADVRRNAGVWDVRVCGDGRACHRNGK